MTGEHLQQFMLPGLDKVQATATPEAQPFCASFWGGAAAYGTVSVKK